MTVAGWDLVRAVDLYPQRTADHVHFARARMEGRVLVANDQDMLVIANQALARGETFPGLVWWPRSLYRRMTYGALARYFEMLAAEEDPFGNLKVRVPPGP